MTDTQKQITMEVYEIFRGACKCEVSRLARVMRLKAAVRPNEKFEPQLYKGMTNQQASDCWQAVWLAISTKVPITDVIGEL
jgi:hypothetical protein